MTRTPGSGSPAAAAGREIARTPSLVAIRLKSIGDWWERQPFLTYAGLFFVIYALAAAALLVRYEWNPSVFFRFGHYYALQNADLVPDGALVFTGEERYGGNGYDGQIFYFYSRTLFLPGRWPNGFNNAYRAPRVGFPLLGAALVSAGSWAVAAGLLAAQVVLILLGGAVLYRLLPAGRKGLLLLYILSPFMLQSTLLMVSDSIVAAFLLIGFYFYAGARSPFAGDTSGTFDLHRANAFHLWLAWVIFGLALLTKESSVFLLFPLGLHALITRDFRRAIALLAALGPYIAWQLYLRQAHGMVPAGVLSVFLSPLDGVVGLVRESAGIAEEALRGVPGALSKLSRLPARLLLVVMIGAAAFSLFKRGRRHWLPFRLAVVLTLASVLIADHYYFWSVYENISRMFTPLVIVVILLAACERSVPIRPFVATFSLLAAMVLVRSVLLVPDFPYERFTQEPAGERFGTPHTVPVPGRTAPVLPR